MGVCVENKKNIFVTDAQVGAVKLSVITDVGHAVKFLLKYIKKTIPGLYSSPEAQVTTHCKFTRGGKERNKVTLNVCSPCWEKTRKGLLQIRQSSQ